MPCRFFDRRGLRQGPRPGLNQGQRLPYNPCHRLLVEMALSIAIASCLGLGLGAACSHPPRAALVEGPSSGAAHATAVAAERNLAQPSAGRQATAVDQLGLHDTVNFAVIGDFGHSGAAAGAVAEMVQQWVPAPDVVVTLGDNNYPDGSMATMDDNVGQHYHRYIRFDETYRGRYYSKEALTRPQRFFPSLGNHDWYSKGAAPYLAYFSLPNNERYYHQRLGPVALFVLDSDVHEPDGIGLESPQATWLRQALADSDARWKVVVMHHAPFATGDNGPHPHLQWPFRAWGASLVMSGHDHIYEKTLVDGFPYLVCGISGAPRDAWRSATGAAKPEGPAHLVYDADYGALRVSADDQHMLIELVTLNNGVQDTVRLPMQ